jgi:predicted RNA-binding protein (virulence factor B family)
VINIGLVNKLYVSRETDKGYFLKDGDSGNEVFMPRAMSPFNANINQEIPVFVYLGTDGEPVASSEIPYAVVGEYAFLRVAEVQEMGAFFDFGIEKDLLVPGNEQKLKVKEHENYIVRICLEEGTNRVYGSTKLGKFIEDGNFDIFEEDKVDIVPVQKTDLGYKCIVNKKYIGMIYHNEIFENVVTEKAYKGVVKKIRNDGLVDLALQIQGIKNLDQSKKVIMELLADMPDGKSRLHDKSSPDEIKDILGMSKKTFKSAIGMLYKDKKILISKDGIELINKVVEVKKEETDK